MSDPMGVLTTQVTAGPAVQHAEARATAVRTQLFWFIGGVALSFLVPFLFSSVLSVHHDVYYGIYFAAAGAFLYAYVWETEFDVVRFFTRNWKWSLVLGALSTAFVVANVLSRDGTDGPVGIYAAFEFTWRGLIYGTVDALLLTAFPGAVAFSMLAWRTDGLWRKLLFVLVSFGLIVTITGAYHLGYEQYREDGIRDPEIGNSVMSVPLLATGNPLGSLIAHASMHGTADIHVYETDIFLPPQTDAP